MSANNREAIRLRNREATRGIEPAEVFAFFADIAAVPRESGNTKEIGDYLVDFAARRGLEHHRDAVGNVVIRKPAQRSSATEGVVLQGHMDMVCVKEPGSTHDFAGDAIEFVLRDGGDLVANGTTLGADDGIGMAMALAFLDSRDLAHPPLEALFTVDEETDMKGAKAITADMLRGTHLVNLDAEELGLAYVSCAAGRSLLIELPLARAAEFPANAALREIRIDGLRGGHSGAQINAGFANAFVLLARLLADAAKTLDIGLAAFDMGADKGADNAIPAKARALVSVAEGDAAGLDALIGEWRKVFANEYRVDDPGVWLHCAAAAREDFPHPPLTRESAERFLRFVRLLPLGVFRFVEDERRMTDIPYRDLLVETSCNLGIARLEADKAVLRPLARGSVGSALDDVTARIADLAALAGASCAVANRTAGWEAECPPPRIQRLFAEQAETPWKLTGVHGGLECGCLIELFAQAGRRLHAVSVGPSIDNPHSPQEVLHTGTVKPMWDSLVAVVEALARGD